MLVLVVLALALALAGALAGALAQVLGLGRLCLLLLLAASQGKTAPLRLVQRPPSRLLRAQPPALAPVLGLVLVLVLVLVSR